jgi:hypothetical protein
LAVPDIVLTTLNARYAHAAVGIRKTLAAAYRSIGMAMVVLLLVAGTFVATGCGGGSAAGAGGSTKIPATSAHVVNIPQASATSPSADAIDAGDDDTDPEWLVVRAAHVGPDQAEAIVKINNYRQMNPSKHDAELAKFEEDALELLWWDRILELWNRRTDLDAVIRAKKAELSAQPHDDYYKTLEGELTDLRQRRDDANRTLTVDMGYMRSIPPDMDDPVDLARLDSKRDPAKFERWGRSVLIWIREHNGRPPWADE